LTGTVTSYIVPEVSYRHSFARWTLADRLIIVLPMYGML
jgi:hypothetical protein